MPKAPCPDTQKRKQHQGNPPKQTPKKVRFLVSSDSLEFHSSFEARSRLCSHSSQISPRTPASQQASQQAYQHTGCGCSCALTQSNHSASLTSAPSAPRASTASSRSPQAEVDRHSKVALKHQNPHPHQQHKYGYHYKLQSRPTNINRNMSEPQRGRAPGGTSTGTGTSISTDDVTAIKKETFRHYLSERGVTAAITKVLASLYDEPSKPEDPIDYIRRELGAGSGLDSDSLRTECSNLKDENACLKDENANLRKELEALKQQQRDEKEKKEKEDGDEEEEEKEKKQVREQQEQHEQYEQEKSRQQKQARSQSPGPFRSFGRRSSTRRNSQ